MHFAKVISAQTSSLEAHLVYVEVDLARGLHAFSIVGLPDKGVGEARDRVGAAIKNSGFVSPKQKNQKVVISLAPADLKKEGTIFDLAMALGYLLAADEIRFRPEGRLFLGELSLDGSLRPIKGTLALARKAKESGIREIFLPKENAVEAALIGGIDIYPASSLREAIDHINLRKMDDESERLPKIRKQEQTEYSAKAAETRTDFADIAGQESAKRALEIAAAGGHNIVLWGPPGTGKTLLAEAFAGLLPPLSFEEALEVTAIHSIAGTLQGALMQSPPFRSPHHTASYVSMIGGGGGSLKPGEITLAHRGVLFVDEFPEFDRRAMDSLRQPLEDRRITISRARGSASFPASFILVAAFNPCPCGNAGMKSRSCSCSAGTLVRYAQRISGPIIDRIDLWVEVGQIDHAKLGGEGARGEISAEIRKRICAARDVQRKRFGQEKIAANTNGELRGKDISKAIVMEPGAKALLGRSAAALDLSARSYHRVMKLARTIADLDEKETVGESHILEALRYRPKNAQRS